jgi:hypothetical protein
MKDQKIEDLFERLQDHFDVEEPSVHHESKFLNKLNQSGKQSTISSSKTIRTFWKPLIGIAASVVLLIIVFLNVPQDSSHTDLASISPEMAETESFFTSTIASELVKIQEKTTPETALLIKDAMLQMEVLEKEYESLKLDLSESGSDKRVISAMISNFQNRITLLQNTLEHIENIKQLKTNRNENSITL